VITLVSNPMNPELSAFCRQDIFGSRVYTGLQAYGTGFPFFSVWQQADGRNQLTAVLCALDGQATLYAAENAEAEELAAFIHMQGFNSVFCSCQNALMLELPATREGAILIHEDKSRLRVRHAVDFEPPGQAVYELLSEADGPWVKLPPFDVWYADVNHRIRHGACTMAAVMEGDKALSCGMILSDGIALSLLGGVATHPDHQGHGYAGSVISALLEVLYKKQKTPYLFRDKGKNQRFYENLGFAPVGKWALCESQELSFRN